MQIPRSRARLTVLALAALAALAGCSAASTGPVHSSAPTVAARKVVAAAPVAVTSNGVTSNAAVSPQAAARATAPAAPEPSPNPCATNTHRRFVRVSLRSQHLWMCAARTLAYSTPITSGIAGPDTSTPTGHFTIQGLDRNTVLTLNTGKQYDVKYWIPFQAPLFGFHDASWQTFPYGSPHYRTDGSHGCVHMPLKAIAFLYRWADVGASVTIA